MKKIGDRADMCQGLKPEGVIWAGILPVEISGAKGLAQEITTWKGCGGQGGHQTCSSERGLGKVGMNNRSVVEDKKEGKTENTLSLFFY